MLPVGLGNDEAAASALRDRGSTMSTSREAARRPTGSRRSSTTLAGIALLALALSACNTPPMGLVVEIQPAEPAAGEALVAAVVELPGGDVEVAWSWTRDGEPQTDLDDEDRVPTGRTVAGETWRVVGLPIADKLIGEAALAEVIVGTSDRDGDGVSGPEGDCDDEDASIFPGNPEVCDGQDNDCDASTWAEGEQEDADGDAALGCEDCDDGDASTFPGNPEICDGQDNDCDDETWAAPGEEDGDGDGAPNCDDCDDDEARRFPGNPEVCDERDNDCDDTTWAAGEDLDEDGDGSPLCGDCDDGDPANFPHNGELCDGQDNDCDEETWAPSGEQDVDADGEMPCGGDCDDSNADVHPGAPELCANGLDDDCDAATLDAFDGDGDGSSCDDDCDDGDIDVFPGAPDQCDAVDDNDCDGLVDPLEQDDDGDGSDECGGDCDDDDPSSFVGAPELCDGIDNDCDASIDEGFDVDGDGQSTCDGDCDDAAPGVFAGAPELCDAVDNDCDAQVDEGFDGDDDSYFDGDDPGCASTYGDDADCDDTLAAVGPSAADVCDGIADNNCDGAPDPQESDDDGDGTSECAGDCDDSDPALTGVDVDGDGFSSCGGDCDDDDPTMNRSDADADGDSSCDGDCDDDDASLNLDDADGDGDSSCDGDCDDTDPTLDLTDDDGDGQTTCGGDCDDDDPALTDLDADGDGASPCGGDCDDADPTLNLDDADGDAFSPCDGDCDDGDPALDPGDADADSFSTCEGDCDDDDPLLDPGDGDGDGESSCGGDCDDGDPSIGPDATEACANGLDDDCDAGTPDLFDGDGDGLLCDEDCDDDDANVAACIPQDILVQGMTLLAMPGGTFEMGCTASQSSCDADELPSHDVTLTHNLWLGETEVTQDQWQGVLGTNPSYFGPHGGGSDCGPSCPVELVNWFEAAAFANAVSVAEGLAPCYTLGGCTGTLGGGCGSSPACSSGTYSCSAVTLNASNVYVCAGYRLPTEAEWEYAARARTDLHEYAGSNTVDGVAWYDANSAGTTHEVAGKLPNALDPYDLSGNVWEWAWDHYDGSSYSSSPVSDPEGPALGSSRLVRGGSWSSPAADARVANRASAPPSGRHSNLGFRLARTIP